MLQFFFLSRSTFFLHRAQTPLICLYCGLVSFVASRTSSLVLFEISPFNFALISFPYSVHHNLYNSSNSFLTSFSHCCHQRWLQQRARQARALYVRPYTKFYLEFHTVNSFYRDYSVSLSLWNVQFFLYLRNVHWYA